MTLFGGVSGLIRPPSRPESIDHGPNPVTERNIQEKTTVRQEWPHPNTATMIEYLRRMEWKTPFLRRLRSINMQWKMQAQRAERRHESWAIMTMMSAETM